MVGNDMRGGIGFGVANPKNLRITFSPKCGPARRFLFRQQISYKIPVEEENFFALLQPHT